MARLYPLVLLLLSLGCTPPRESPSPQPAVIPDTELCSPMCDHLATLKCEEARPTYDSDLPGPRGVPNLPCSLLCAQLQGNGYFVNPKCVMMVAVCTDIEAARKRKCD